MKDIYHVIGYPVKHSLSPKIQMQLARQYNQEMEFTAIEIAPDDLEEKIAQFKSNHAVKGLSVTVPHKEKVFKLADSADATANLVKAASNVIFTSDRKMVALNYDGLGIINDIKLNYKTKITDKKILVVGAGGAAKAVIAALILESPQAITIANRTKSKADLIKKLFAERFDIKVEDFESINGCYDIVINSTSLSIDGKLLPLRADNFSKEAFAYDLMYGDKGTVFTQWCDKNNIRSADGKGMLFELSKAVFKYWRGL